MDHGLLDFAETVSARIDGPVVVAVALLAGLEVAVSARVLGLNLGRLQNWLLDRGNHVLRVVVAVRRRQPELEPLVSRLPW